MLIDNKYLALICNDLDNFEDYSVDGDNCFHKEKLIGKISSEFIDSDDGIIHKINYQSLTPIEFINVELNINYQE